MPNHNSNSELLAVIPGVIAVVAVAALGYYLCVVQLAPPTGISPVSKVTYPVDTVQKEFTTGVFTKLPDSKSSEAGKQTDPEVIKYQSGDLGKTDLTKLE